MWKQICLRATGFPASTLLGLAAPETARLIDAVLDDERRKVRTFQSARAELEAAYEQDWLRIGERLHEVARMPRFREAVIWQNRTVIQTGIEPLLRRPPGASDRKTREYKQMVASYLQRYCTKNDSIGFFGPIGWATFDDALSAPRLVPGPALLDRRTVYFEHWAIDALAGRLSEDRALRIGLAPRRMPTIRLDGDRLHHSIDRVTTLPASTIRLIEACDGTRSARAIAEALAAEPGLELESPDEVYDLLDELAEARLVIWRLEVPPADLQPERRLQAALAAAEPGPARADGEAALAALVAARDRVAAAAGDPDALEAALGALGEAFVGLTDREASRLAGKTYAGRGVVYEDCRRAAEVVLGRPFLDRIGPALSWIQASARWFTHTLATRFRAVFDEVYRRLAAELGAPEVDFIRFYAELRAQLTGQASAQSSTALEVRAELQRRWAELLALPEGQRRVELSAAELGPRVQAAFEAPAPGWPSARHNSPDLMIAAAGPEALASGDYLVVLGEVHAAVSAVSVPAIAKEHVDPDGIHRVRQVDLGPTVAQVLPRGNFHRGRYFSLSEGNLDVEFGDARSHRPRDQVFDVAGFVVCERDGQLRVRRRDGSAEFDLVSFLEADFEAESYIFDIFGPAAYRPRVTVDGFVLARERWQFSTAGMAFTRRDPGLDRFAGARRWVAEHQLPRFVFIKASGEPKPVYLDLESPIFVEILCKLVRASETVTVSEMLPSFEQLWLLDADGAAYCSELRMVVVDDVAARPGRV
ncbi:MAG TPA: lantibiotic dehydratase [Kofleriaceae bacterium]